MPGLHDLRDTCAQINDLYGTSFEVHHTGVAGYAVENEGRVRVVFDTTGRLAPVINLFAATAYLNGVVEGLRLGRATPSNMPEIADA